jgi:xanthine dehydrogenase accessory factor
MVAKDPVALDGLRQSTTLVDLALGRPAAHRRAGKLRGSTMKVERDTSDDESAATPAHSVEDALFREIVRLRESGTGAALATVIAVEGSAPAREPMKILVRADGTTLGSVGGGCLEEEVKRRALQVIEEDRTARVAMSLTAEDTPDGALICGGRVEVFLEPITAPTALLFGGGHVSRAVASLASRVGFRVVVTDDRPEYASRERFPSAAHTFVEYADVAARTAPIDGSTFVLVMTRTHAADRQILHELWRRGARPRWLGMIGSGTKARLTFEQLTAAGVDREWLRRVRTPVGLRIGARTADEIAVSIVAEMVAVRRGKPEGKWSVKAPPEALADDASEEVPPR